MLGPLVTIVLGVALILVSRRFPERAQQFTLPIGTSLVGLGLWDGLCRLQAEAVFPTPLEVWRGLLDLMHAQKGEQVARLWRYIVASLFRVSVGFSAAVLVGIPLGLLAGWSTRTFLAMNPLIQGLRPISPIAWIPVSILWFGVGDGAPIFLIFLGAFFPIVVGTMAAVRNISQVHVRSAQNFGLHGLELFRRVVFPAALPQIITGLRIALGVGWLVVVAAEMIAVNSGLGYLINDARNMGMRYDLVVAGMLVIGAIGIVLDFGIRRLETFEEVRWGYAKR
jgi:NitT/TauT family transport system permease protein